MSGFGVRVHVDVGLPGHAWVEVSRPDGTTEHWGYGPDGKPLPIYPGELRIEDLSKTEIDWSSPLYEIPENAYNDIMDYIHERNRNPGTYSVGWNDCVEFVDQVLELGGLPNIPDGQPVWPEHLPLEWGLYERISPNTVSSMPS